MYLAEDGPVTNAADIWTYGLILWEMISLSVPHTEEFDESFNDSFIETDSTDNKLDDSNSIMENIFPEEVMSRVSSKYGK